MRKYLVRVHSCRKDTKVVMQLNHVEANAIKRLALKTQRASQSECEPTVFIYPLTTVKPSRPVVDVVKRHQQTKVRSVR